MKNFKKAAVLGLLILAIPAFFFGFRFCSHNNFDVEIMYPNGPHGQSPGETHQVKDFQLTDQRGNAYNFQKGQDKLYIVDFIFTRCGSFCPILTRSLIRVQDRFSDEARVELLSISVDPDFDQPKVLADYAKNFGVKYDQWKLLTGEKGEVYDIIKQEFLLPVQDTTVSDHDFIHSDRIVLMDALGRIRGYYYGQEEEDVDRLIGETKVLLQSKTNGFTAK